MQYRRPKYNGYLSEVTTVSRRTVNRDERYEKKNVPTRFLPLDEAIAFRAVFLNVSKSDGRMETLLEPAK